jgi:methylmalonyl-CoA mutase
MQMMIVPSDRTRYLADIAASVRGYHAKTRAQVKLIREIQHLREAAHMLHTEDEAIERLKALADERRSKLDPSCASLLQSWPALAQSYQGREQVTKVRDREIRTALTTTSLSGTVIPKVALPRYEDDGEMLSFLRREHLPGFFPYTAGVFPFKREGEDPTRMFAGEGDPFRTNRRFKLISEGMKAKRLSTALTRSHFTGRTPMCAPIFTAK